MPASAYKLYKNADLIFQEDLAPDLTSTRSNDADRH